MNTQSGGIKRMLSGCFTVPSVAPVAGRSLAGQTSIKRLGP